MLKDAHNVLLVKDDVGKSKPATRELPPETFAYGKSAGKDEEGAAEGRRGSRKL
jgi:hypothetical protein